MISEERIKELLGPIIAKLFEWSVRVRRPSYGTIEGFVQSTFKAALYAVAAESRKEGIEEATDVAVKLAYDVMGNTVSLARSYSERLIEAVERLKGQG